MDTNLYSKDTIHGYRDENLFFKDKILQKYFEENKPMAFRKRLATHFKTKDLEPMIYAFVTDSIRDIVYEIIGKLNKTFKKAGDLILSGGDAVNYYLLLDERIITLDIDTKFIPRMNLDTRFFGKLQAIKLLFWNELGKIAKTYSSKIKQRLEQKSKLCQFLGISFDSQGPYVTRRYTIKRKTKESKTEKPSLEDILIDVEIFALDLKLKYFSPKDGKVMPFNLGGILDIAFMRPNEFGYEIAEAQSISGLIYRNNKGKLIQNPNIFVAKRRFLIEDIFLMHKLGLRPHKKKKDKQRIVKLMATYPELKSIKPGSIESIFVKYEKSPVAKTKKHKIILDGKVNIQSAAKVNPLKYEKYTTEPSTIKLKRLSHASQQKTNGFKLTKSEYRFDINKKVWVINKSKSYIKNEYKYRLNTNSKKYNVPQTTELYGFKKSRNIWVPKKVIESAAMIPFVGLKK
ncbi:hypothetical protein [Dishui Lake phycodnavirus 4]|nr:hypothetical protein [Dishui Lake phycodnavirus 4]